jgi:hypothetical protein
MVIPGSITFGISYGLSIYFAALASTLDPVDRPTNAGWLYAPVVGPWIALAAGTETCSEEWNSTLQEYETVCTREADLDQLLILDGGAQAIGAGLLILGLAWRYQYLTRVDAARTTVVPMIMGRSGYGLTVLGSF